MSIDFSRYPKTTLDRFKKFHGANPHVYREFKKHAFAIRNTGRQKYSAEIIVNVIRWHRDLQTGGDVFKINNDFKSIYARLLAHNHPEFEDFFEFRNHAPNWGKLSEEERRRRGDD